ncbi:hypothetical protein EZV62_000255 [Acer yangbiense]|uniref:Uncharacterized protein n=1 Tax=Acer yangbiense TaxID=1000413 RepID=A0A5C7ITH5_9ROSI|nr:hypothetical protein EZV62_000255 [Acer yangbiense]
MAAQYQREDLLKAGREGFAILDAMYGRQAKISPPPPPPPPPTPTPAPHFHHHHRGHQYEYYDHQQSYYVYRGPRVVTVIREPAVIDSYQAVQLYGGTMTIEYERVAVRDAKLDLDKRNGEVCWKYQDGESSYPSSDSEAREVGFCGLVENKDNEKCLGRDCVVGLMVYKSENPHKSMGQEFAYEEGVLRSPNYKLGSVGGSLSKNDIGHGVSVEVVELVSIPVVVVEGLDILDGISPISSKRRRERKSCYSIKRHSMQTRFSKTKEITKAINNKEKETVGNAKQQVRESHSDLDKVNQLAEAHRVVWNLVHKRWGVKREETNCDKLGAAA